MLSKLTNIGDGQGIICVKVSTQPLLSKIDKSYWPHSRPPRSSDDDMKPFGPDHANVGIPVPPITSTSIAPSLTEPCNKLPQETFSESIKPLGDLFITSIKMLIVPLIFSSLVVGVTGMKDPKKMGIRPADDVGQVIGNTIGMIKYANNMTFSPPLGQNFFINSIFFHWLLTLQLRCILSKYKNLNIKYQ